DGIAGQGVTNGFKSFSTNAPAFPHARAALTPAAIFVNALRKIGRPGDLRDGQFALMGRDRRGPKGPRPSIQSRSVPAQRHWRPACCAPTLELRRNVDFTPSRRVHKYMAAELDFTELQALAAEILRVKPERIQKNVSFARDLGADSLDLLE